MATEAAALWWGRVALPPAICLAMLSKGVHFSRGQWVVAIVLCICQFL
jgi:hypothetical protein